MSRMQFGLKSRQRGAAALITTVLLALVLGVVTLNTTNVGMMEQRITGNDLRAREAQEAAEAGLEYATAWAGKNRIPWPANNSLSCNISSGATACCESSCLTNQNAKCSDLACNSTRIICNGTNCPLLQPISTLNTTTLEGYNLSTTYSRVIASSDTIKVSSVSSGAIDGTIVANVESYVKQIPLELFDPGAPSPPPFVLAGCMGSSTNAGKVYLLDEDGNGTPESPAAITGDTPPPVTVDCLPNNFSETKIWDNSSKDNVMDDPDDIGATTPYIPDTYTGCPGAQCAWNKVFKMSLSEAETTATNAGHVYTGGVGSRVPCGAPASSPSIYLINLSNDNFSPADLVCGGASATIGDPLKPVVLIFNRCAKIKNTTIYGIVYMKPEAKCDSNGLGEATIYGSVIWENDVTPNPDVGSPTSNSAQFIEVNWENQGDLDDVFNMPIDSAPRLPGTWKDW